MKAPPKMWRKRAEVALLRQWTSWETARPRPACAALATDFHSFRASQRDMKASQKIDRIHKVYRIDFLPPHPVNLVNPVYVSSFHGVAHLHMNASSHPHLALLLG